ncbi:unnamed protein product [Mytilus coruscus]|uniref:Endonuclease/exonuclease/phosphatase domain-containing protein n=1 Tax=Mytilus coruscus TaxID=42192 RepID=A0A6J8AVW3_MYTCO|nr:unnamed protein product [Mytilus coruscus]
MCVIYEEKFHFQCQKVTSVLYKSISIDSLEQFQCLQCNFSVKDLSTCEIEPDSLSTERHADSLESPDAIITTVVIVKTVQKKESRKSAASLQFYTLNTCQLCSPPDGDNRIQPVEISTTKNPVFLINVYVPSRGTDKGYNSYRATLDTLTEMILKYQRTHTIVIAGDFNPFLDNIRTLVMRYLKN